MRAILTEISHDGVVGHSFPVRVEGCRGVYGRFECIPNASYEGAGLLFSFSKDMRRKYGANKFLPDPFVSKPTIKKVIFNDPATIVIWNDNTKTVVKCQPGDKYDKKLGLALCLSKKLLGNKGNYNEVFKKWIDEPESDISDATIRDELHDYCNRTNCLVCDIPKDENGDCKTIDKMDHEELIKVYKTIK